MLITIDQFQFCRHLEKSLKEIMKIKIVDYIEKLKVLGENQFGFRILWSTVDKLGKTKMEQ